MNEALFEEHRVWAESIAKAVRRRLPPSFELDDLKQTALIAHWGCVEQFDPSRGVPYRAFAYMKIQGAILMSCRRRHYREATHEELEGTHVETRPNPERRVLQKAEAHKAYMVKRRRLATIGTIITKIDPADAYLVRRVLNGADAEVLTKTWGGDPKAWERRIKKAVARLKRARVK